jgi:hypothetical protein
MSVRSGARDPAYQVFLLLRIGFTVAPILMGIDKFFNWMVSWETSPARASCLFGVGAPAAFETTRRLRHRDEL